MPMTIVEKIFARASGQAVVAPGDLVVVEVDCAVMLDMSFHRHQRREVLKVHDPDRIVIAYDHMVPAPDKDSAEAHAYGREFARRFGIRRLHDVGPEQGVSHAIVADNAYALPGTVLVCSDSHTCASGAFNCAARGIGGPDLLAAITTGKTWYRVGETVRYDLAGALRPGVSAKDLFLYLAGTYGHHTNRNVEFGGPGLANLSIDARRTIAAMGAELSAEFATFECDERLVEYVKARNPAPFTPVAPDPDAAYADRRTIDLDRMEPLVALPDAVIDNSVPVSQVAGEKIDQAYIGSCANGSLDDLAEAARVVKGRRVAPGGAAARRAQHPAGLSGGGEGRLCRNPGRGRRGRHLGDLRRLFRRAYGRPRSGRDLHHRLDPQLQGAHGRPVGAHLHGLAGHGGGLGDRRLHRRCGRVRMIAGRVWTFGDNINTDLMLPGALLLATEEEQRRAVFSANRPGWVDQVRPGDIIVGGRNYGMGSSRPAARSLRNCGIAALVAESINGLFFRNAVNFGLVALECPGVAAAFAEGQTAEISLADFTVTNRDTGATLRALPVPQMLLDMMQGGGLYPHLERQGLIAPR